MRSSSSPSPVRALTRTTVAAGDELARLLLREVDRLGVDRVDLRQRDDTALDAEQAQDREVLVRLRARALPRVDHEQEEVDAVAPATIVRTNRSCPGTSMSESLRPSASSSGA